MPWRRRPSGSDPAQAAMDAEAPTPFDEAWYLSTYPDAAASVAAGHHRDGRHHFALVGRQEGRLGSLDGVRPDPNGALAQLRLHHTGASYLAPRDLRASPFRLRRTLVIGICLAEAWAGHHDETHEHRPDFLLVSRHSVLPTTLPHAAAEYDAFVVQIPLRDMIDDSRLWRLAYDDLDGHRGIFAEGCAAIDRYVEKICRWAEPFGVPLLVGNFLLPQADLTGRLLPRYDLRNIVHFTEELNRHLAQSIGRFRSAYLLDVDRIAASFGRRFIQDDAVLWTMHGSLMPTEWDQPRRIEPMASIKAHYDVSWPSGFVAAIWAEVAAVTRTLQQADLVKLVVVDLDDTLWTGVSGDMAEVGPAMIEGWPLGLLEALMYLKKRGVLLAIISKNDGERIRTIWDTIFRGQITLEDFAAVEVNWDGKPDNMARILAALNLLPTNVVFVDDNPVERAAMGHAYPGMRILGRYPFYLRRTLLWAPETQVARISQESANRTTTVRARIERDQAERRLDRDAFLATLDLRVTTFEVTPEGAAFPRAFELLNKTNQFNTTGRRWTLAEITAAQQSGMRVFAFEAQDRFATYGLVGVCLVSGATIEQAVMSCRVNGLDVELAALSDVVAAMRGTGERAIIGHLVETRSNLLCRDLWARCGFTREADGAWRLGDSSTLCRPAHISLAAETASH